MVRYELPKPPTFASLIRLHAPPLHASAAATAPLSTAELQNGVRILDRGGTDAAAFREDMLVRYRLTLLKAIRDTSDALSSPGLSSSLRGVLQSQLPRLRSDLVGADRRIALRASRLRATAIDTFAASIN